MKLKFLMLIFSFLILTACGAFKPVATTHTERIETHLQPIPIGADTIEIVLNVGTRHAVSINPNGNSRDARLERPLTRERQNRHNIQPVGRTDTACRVPTIESVRSTRALSITKTITDTSTRIKLTLQPDTVFVPYTNHIRSDTIVVHDRICETKLQKTQTANVLLILILIIVIIFLLKQKYKFYR